MKVKLIFLFYFIIICFNSFSQSKLNLNDEEKFIKICEAFISIDDIVESITYSQLNNKNAIFILSNTSFIIDPNKKIKIDYDTFSLNIWFKKDLFFNNINYWYDFYDICETKNKIIIKFRSYNSVNSKNLKPIFKGEFVLKSINGHFSIIRKNVISSINNK